MPTLLWIILAEAIAATGAAIALAIALREARATKEAMEDASRFAQEALDDAWRDIRALTQTMNEADNARMRGSARAGVVVRPEVVAYSIAQEQVLRRHDAKKGGRDGWRELTYNDHVDGIFRETSELINVLASAQAAPSLDARLALMSGVAYEAVDVGNFAAFIFDKATAELAEAGLEWTPQGYTTMAGYPPAS